MPELLQATLLTLAASAGVIRLGIARRGYGEPYQPALFCVQLAFALAAGTGACAVAQLAFGFDTLEARRWLLQATLLLGFPLIGCFASAWLACRWPGCCRICETIRTNGSKRPHKRHSAP